MKALDKRSLGQRVTVLCWLLAAMVLLILGVNHVVSAHPHDEYLLLVEEADGLLALPGFVEPNVSRLPALDRDD